MLSLVIKYASSQNYFGFVVPVSSILLLTQLRGKHDSFKSFAAIYTKEEKSGSHLNLNRDKYNL